MAETARAPAPHAGSSTDLRLWLALSVGPVAWMTHLLLGYGYASWFACELRRTWPIYALTVVALAGAMLGLVLGFRSWSALINKDRDGSNDTAKRREFMAVVSIGLALLSIVGIIFNTAPATVLSRCV
jgi:hypothetical protein